MLVVEFLPAHAGKPFSPGTTRLSEGQQRNKQGVQGYGPSPKDGVERGTRGRGQDQARKGQQSGCEKITHAGCSIPDTG